MSDGALARGEECCLHKHLPLSSETKNPYKKPDVATQPPVVSIGTMAGEFLESAS